MKFAGKSVRSLTKLMKVAGDAAKVRLAVNLNKISNDLLVQLGFDETPVVGDYLIPTVLGKYTSFNVNGTIKVRKDLPLEPESVMFYGSSRDWHGGIHYGIRTRTIDKYPRENIPAPSETFEIVTIGESLFLSSSELNLSDADETRNIHVTNIMLECFSEFDIYDVGKDEIVGPRLKRLQWDILPSGECPWDKARPIILKRTEHLEERDKKVIEHRMKTISRREPDFLAVGRAGFSGYFVYGFKDQDVYVLESMELDNATYVFNSEWEAISKLTKSQIINSELPHQRIIHNKRWGVSVGRAISGN
ncbi:hypothetical protein [Pseudoalteromonas agarivorans]|uniref:hypothetical protein n=1 Tax=Pseudoalteromonas agarivorans TaxID=176102 RepID=UPI0003D67880|nr:hypothetical protein [Pseudoalteromonas agarivorans]ETJ47866.1 hypothetical protein X564_10260 [Pseudoalteromonas agarivorans]